MDFACRASETSRKGRAPKGGAVGQSRTPFLRTGDQTASRQLRSLARFPEPDISLSAQASSHRCAPAKGYPLPRACDASSVSRSPPPGSRSRYAAIIRASHDLHSDSETVPFWNRISKLESSSRLGGGSWEKVGVVCTLPI